MRKKFIILSFFLIAFAEVKVHAQALLKMQLLPGHTYTTVSKLYMKNASEYVGDTTKISAISRRLPMGFVTRKTTTLSNKIGDQTRSGLLFTLNFESDANGRFIDINGNEDKDLPVRSKKVIYGTISDKLKIDIDSISNVKKDNGFATLKANYTRVLNEIQANIEFPQRELKVGDSFVDSGMIYTPGAGILQRLRIHTTYILTAMENEKAFFDTKTDITVDLHGRHVTIDTAGGTGKMVYDMGINYPISIQKNIKVEYSESHIPGLKMNTSLVIITDQQNAVTF